jgi:hypothetical protein
MKIFRNTAIDDSPPDTQRGFGYVWDSASGALEELRWSWPTRYLRQSKVEGYRVSDGKVYGQTTFQMEADGQQYVSSLYLATPGTTDIVTVDLGDGYEFITSTRPQFAFGDMIISVVQRFRGLSPLYVVCDYSGPTPTHFSADATEWVNSGVMDYGETTGMIDGQGRVRLFGFYQTGETEARMYISSPLDGTALTVSETILVDPPTVPAPVDIPSVVAAGAITSLWLKGKVPELADAKLTTYALIATVEGYGTLVQSLGPNSFAVYLPSGGISVQATQYDWDTGETDVFLVTTDSAGVVVSSELLAATVGNSAFAGAITVYPDLHLAPPAVPPFWRGFIKAYETI